MQRGPAAMPLWMGIAVAIAGASGGCSEPLEFADWTIPVPEGTEVLSYAPAALDERDGTRIEQVEELVVRSRGDDERYLLYRPADLDVGPDGRIYVLDRGDFNVKVYDASGEHVVTFARQGQGPGELSSPRAAAVVGDRYVVGDDGTRLLIWSLDGEYLDEHATLVQPASRPFVGLTDGSAVLTAFTLGRGSSRDDLLRAAEQGSLKRALGALPIDGSDVRVLLDVPEELVLLSASTTALRSSTARAFAAARDGTTYFTEGDEYQVLSLDDTGTARWALRVAWPRQPYSEEEIEHRLEAARQRTPSLSRSDLEIAAFAPTLAQLRVDGHGHLYVLLRIFSAAEDASEDRPVDVYGADGSHLFSGFMPSSFWRDAHGDFVYAFVFDQDAGEQTIVRYRLVEPFD